MLELVVDTNVLVSSLIAPGKPRTIVLALTRGEATLVISPDLFDELLDVLKRPKFDHLIDKAESELLIRFIENRAHLVTPRQKLNICRDPKDNKVLACALEAKVDCIISGDLDLKILHPFQNIEILSPSDFLKRLKT